MVGGELIIVRSGVNTGDCAVVPQALANSFAAYDLILNFRPNASAKFIGMFLDTTIGRTQLGLVKGRSAQPHINAEEVEALRVPLPQIGDQERFVVLMEKSRESRKAKLADADALLGGIDEFVLEALGINPARKEDRQVFAVKLGESRTQGQLNPEYYHPERILALRALSFAVAGYHVSSLSRVASFQRNQLESPGQGYLSLAHVQSNTGELTDSTDTASGACFMYQANDVLFARLRPYLNKVHVAVGEGCCSTEFHVLRVKDPSTLLPEYLGAILRSRLTLSQTVHMMTGNTHPRLTNRDMENLQIPIPHVDKQRVIADEVVRRRSEARKLRSEAEADWEVAKQWFEEQLLGK